MEYAANGEAGNLWVTAECQSAGKGSRGRQWNSYTGNLLASLLLDTPCNLEHMGGLTFVAANSVYEAVRKFAGDKQNIALKWPNDLLINSKKCAGILLESRTAKAYSHIVVGIGVNCVSFPDAALYPATSLCEEDIAVTREALFQELAVTMADNLNLWDEGRGFALIRRKWLDYASGIGEKISVQLPGHNAQAQLLDGVFKTVDEDGYLLLEQTNGEIVRISTADIFFAEAINCNTNELITR